MFVLEEKPEENISYFQKDGPRTGLGILGAALTLCAMATGYHSALALVSTAWILTGMTAMVGPSMSIRGWICLSSLFQVRASSRDAGNPLTNTQVIPAVVFVILAICQYFWPSDTDTGAPKEMTKLAQPSPWLAELMGLFLWPLITILPAGLVSLSFPSLLYPASHATSIKQPMKINLTVRSALPIDSSTSRMTGYLRNLRNLLHLVLTF
jgi:hypothetical protein